MMLENNKMITAAREGKSPSLISIILMPFIFTMMLSIGITLVSFISIIVFGTDETAMSMVYIQYMQYAISFAIAGGVILLYVKHVQKRSIQSLGFFKERVLSSYFKGLGIAILGIIAIISILQFKGEIILKPSIHEMGLGGLGLIILIGIAWIIQGAAEEILVRGYMFQSISVKYGIYKGIIFSSIIFSLLHLGNSGVTAISLINILLCGLMLVLLVLKDENLWGACGFHTAWNLFQGNIFGISVSGNALDISLFETTIPSSSLWNGGQFGIEGSLLTTAFMLIVCVVLVGQIKKKSI